MTGAFNFNPKTFRTLEFLLLVVVNVAAWLTAIAGSLPDRWAVYATAASGAGYALWRGLAKQNSDVKDYWHTSEFWVAVIASLPAIIAAFANTINVKTYEVLQGVIVMATGIAMGIRKQPDVAAGNIGVADLEGEGELFVPDDPDDFPDDADDSVLAGQPHADPAAPTATTLPAPPPPDEPQPPSDPRSKGRRS
jgi:hypothetical protein